MVLSVLFYLPQDSSARDRWWWRQGTAPLGIGCRRRNTGGWSMPSPCRSSLSRSFTKELNGYFKTKKNKAHGFFFMFYNGWASRGSEFIDFVTKWTQKKSGYDGDTGDTEPLCTRTCSDKHWGIMYELTGFLYSCSRIFRIFSGVALRNFHISLRFGRFFSVVYLQVGWGKSIQDMFHKHFEYTVLQNNFFPHRCIRGQWYPFYFTLCLVSVFGGFFWHALVGRKKISPRSETRRAVFQRPSSGVRPARPQPQRRPGCFAHTCAAAPPGNTPCMSRRRKWRGLQRLLTPTTCVRSKINFNFQAV